MWDGRYLPPPPKKWIFVLRIVFRWISCAGSGASVKSTIFWKFTTSDFATRYKCFKCHRPKADAAAGDAKNKVPPGLWDCPACGTSGNYHIHVSRKSAIALDPILGGFYTFRSLIPVRTWRQGTLFEKFMWCQPLEMLPICWTFLVWSNK